MSQNHETKNKLYGHRLQIGASEGLDPITGFGPGGKFGSVPDITRASLLLDNPVTGLNTNGLRSSSMPGLVQDRLRSSLPSKITGLGEVNAVRGVRQAEFTFTKTAGKHLTDFVNHGENAGQFARPYMKSPLTIQEIMSTGKGVPDSFFKGGMNWRVPGSFRGEQGIWELGINP
jgi:hypothetical protein